MHLLWLKFRWSCARHPLFSPSLSPPPRAALFLFLVHCLLLFLPLSRSRCLSWFIDIQAKRGKAAVGARRLRPGLNRDYSTLCNQTSGYIEQSVFLVYDGVVLFKPSSLPCSTPSHRVEYLLWICGQFRFTIPSWILRTSWPRIFLFILFRFIPLFLPVFPSFFFFIKS